MYTSIVFLRYILYILITFVFKVFLCFTFIKGNICNTYVYNIGLWLVFFLIFLLRNLSFLNIF